MFVHKRTLMPPIQPRIGVFQASPGKGCFSNAQVLKIKHEKKMQHRDLGDAQPRAPSRAPAPLLPTSAHIFRSCRKANNARSSNGFMWSVNVQNLWDVRRWGGQGDPTAENIFVQVGRALSHWELLESQLAELFDCLVSGAPSATESNRAGFVAYREVKASSARTELLKAAIPRALMASRHLEPATVLAKKVGEFGSRRNEIAHGMAVNLGEHGHCLAPSNLSASKWHSKGHMIGQAKFQYAAADIEYYAVEFARLYDECGVLVGAIYGERRE